MRRVASLLHRIIEKKHKARVCQNRSLVACQGWRKQVFPSCVQQGTCDDSYRLRNTDEEGGVGNLVFEIKKNQIKNKLRVRVECE